MLDYCLIGTVLDEVVEDGHFLDFVFGVAHADLGIFEQLRPASLDGEVLLCLQELF